MLVVGWFGFAGGNFISIKNQPSSKLLKNAYASSSGTANKIITDIMPSG
jgi:ammonia channel protein AmtB